MRPIEVFLLCNYTLYKLMDFLLSLQSHAHAHTHTHTHTPHATAHTDTAVSDIEEAFKNFTGRKDIAIVLINQNVSELC